MAKEIDLEDPFENIGARIVREVASKVAEKSGNFGYNAMTATYEDVVSTGVRSSTSQTSIPRRPDTQQFPFLRVAEMSTTRGNG